MLKSTDYKIAFIGFGEAASAFVTGWRREIIVNICAYDIKTTQSGEIADRKLSDYARTGVAGCETHQEALVDADVVFSMVTADQALIAATDAAQHIAKSAHFFDCNSCAPKTKQRAADLITKAGAHYIDTAVMSPVHPKLHQTPVSICGDSPQDAMTILNDLQMNATLVDGAVGKASSIKMVRSIMVKGLEALMAECVLAGRQAGVDAEVLESLDKSYPGFDFPTKASYMLERSMIHGIRRAAEMREVALTVNDLGLDNDMSEAIVHWQQRIGDLKLAVNEADYQNKADEIIKALTPKRAEE